MIDMDRFRLSCKAYARIDVFIVRTNYRTTSLALSREKMRMKVITQTLNHYKL